MSKKQERNTRPQAPARPATQPVKAIVEAISVNAPAFLSNYRLKQLVIFLAGMLFYVNTVTLDYAVDDSIVIQRNRFTQRGLAGLEGLFGYDTFFGFFNETKNLVAGGRYRPLSLATFALEVQLFAPVKKDDKGNDIRIDDMGNFVTIGSPDYDKAHKCYDIDHNKTSVHVISHIVNIIMYGILCWVLYLFLLLLLNPQREASNAKANFIVFAAALLYAVHPLHTEAVANIKGRDEIMTLLGSLLAAYWLLKAHYNPSKTAIYFAGAVIAFFAALLSKESAVTFIGVIPMSFFFFTNASIKDIAIKTVPLVVTFAIFFGIRAKVLGDGGSLMKNNEIKELMNNPYLRLSDKAKLAKLHPSSNVKYVTNPNTESYVPVTGGEKMAMMAHTWGHYLRLLVVPHPLTNDYYPRHIPLSEMGASTPMFSLLINLLLLGLGFWGLTRKTIWSYGLLFYFMTFSIVSNLVFPIGTNMSERFMFMPSIGICLVFGWFLWGLVSSFGQKAVIAPKDFSLALTILGVVALLYGGKTFFRNFDWKNDYTLFVKDIEVSKESAKLTMAASGEMMGESERRMNKEIEAANALPDAASRENAILAAQKARTDRVLEAKTQLEKSLEIHPGFANAWLLYGNANVHLGTSATPTPKDTDGNIRGQKIQKAKNLFELALKAYEQVDTWRPNHADVKQNKGVAFRELGKIYGEGMGDIPNAIRFLAEATKLNAGDSEAWRLLGTAYGIAGDNAKAAETFEESLRLFPNNTGSLQNLSVAYQNLGRLDKAEEVLIKLCELYAYKDPGITNLLRRNYQLRGNAAKEAEMRAKIKEVDPNFVIQ